MTVTSIGYGEMLPVNPVEHAVCTLCMLSSDPDPDPNPTLTQPNLTRMGSACAMAATMDPEGVAFRTNLDALNYFMRDRNLPHEERIALREYFPAVGIAAQLRTWRSPQAMGALRALESPSLVPRAAPAVGVPPPHMSLMCGLLAIPAQVLPRLAQAAALEAGGGAA